MSILHEVHGKDAVRTPYCSPGTPPYQGSLLYCLMYT